ncbi:MAG TPA: SDR family oxidoreductase [Sphingobium sp.]
MTAMLDGKVALVTGGAGDVGRVIVERMLAEGASVVATDFDEAKLTDILAGKDHAIAVQHDVTSETDWDKVVARGLEAFGKLNILVNCAGMTPVSLIENTTLEGWNRVFAVNTTGPFLGMRAALPALKAAAASSEAGAAIVNIASAQGLMAGQPGLAPYAGSKGALRLLTRTAAVEFGRLGYNIRCNSVVPSAIGGSALMTSQLSNQVDRGVFESLEQAMKTITSAFPLGHTASPLDVAEAVVFLASDRARSITGIDLPVDSGRCA